MRLIKQCSSAADFLSMTILPGGGVPEGWRPVEPAYPSQPPTQPPVPPEPSVTSPDPTWAPPQPTWVAPRPAPTLSPSSRVPARKVTGGVLLSSAWGLVQRDRALLVLPVLSFVTSLAALGLVLGPIGLAAWRSGDAASFVASTHLVLDWVLLTITTAIAVFFQAALVVVVNAMMEGRSVSLGEALRVAVSRLPQILLWAAIAATVGLVLRMIGERGIAGAIVRVIGGLAWAIASFFVVPVLVVEQVSPFDALRRSTSLISQTWGKALRAGIRFGLVQVGVFLGIMVLFGLGIAMWSASPVLGGLLVVLGVVAIIAASVVFSTLSQVLNTVLYRYAAGLPVPGVDESLLQGAFTARG